MRVAVTYFMLPPLFFLLFLHVCVCVNICNITFFCGFLLLHCTQMALLLLHTSKLDTVFLSYLILYYFNTNFGLFLFSCLYDLLFFHISDMNKCMGNCYAYFYKYNHKLISYCFFAFKTEKN